MIDPTTSNNAIADLSRECSRLERELASAREAQRVAVAGSAAMSRAIQYALKQLPTDFKATNLWTGQEIVERMLTARQELSIDTTAGADLLAELERLRESVKNYEAMKQGVMERIGDLENDLKQAIFPGWQSYEEWLKNGRTNPKAARGGEG